MKESEFERLKQGQEIKKLIEDVRKSLNLIKQPSGTLSIILNDVVYGGSGNEVKLCFFSEGECIKTLELMLEDKIIELEKEFEEL